MHWTIDHACTLNLLSWFSILNKRQLYLHVFDLEGNLQYIRSTRVNQFAIPLHIIGNQYQIKLPKLSYLFCPSILFMPQDGISLSHLLLSGLHCTESIWLDNITRLETMLNPSMLGHFMQNYFSSMLHLLFSTFNFYWCFLEVQFRIMMLTYLWMSMKFSSVSDPSFKAWLLQISSTTFTTHLTTLTTLNWKKS